MMTSEAEAGAEDHQPRGTSSCTSHIRKLVNPLSTGLIDGRISSEMVRWSGRDCTVHGTTHPAEKYPDAEAETEGADEGYHITCRCHRIDLIIMARGQKVVVLWRKQDFRDRRRG